MVSFLGDNWAHGLILVTYHFSGLITSGKVHCFRKKLTCEPDPSVVSFLPGLALMKTTVLESMRTLSYFRLDTLMMMLYGVLEGPA